MIDLISNSRRNLGMGIFISQHVSTQYTRTAIRNLMSAPRVAQLKFYLAESHKPISCTVVISELSGMVFFSFQ